MIEICYVSQYKTDWECVVCKKKIPAEQIQESPMALYQPSSRYWLPTTKPGVTRGVFCSPECGKIHMDIVHKLFPEANNELPQGL